MHKTLIFLTLFFKLGYGLYTCYTNVCEQLQYQNNNNYQFFDPNTFGQAIHPDPTNIIRSNSQFRDFVNSNVDCTGKYCVKKNNEYSFSCSGRGSKDCYHVEHMYDVNGNDPGIPAMCRSCKNIPGNMVMAYGRWNSALGGLAGSNYTLSKMEKISVYSLLNMVNARNSIAACCNRMYRREVMEINLIENIIVDTSNTLYPEICDDEENCNCDLDSECGCDCDFNDGDIIMEYQKANLGINIVILILLVFIFVGIIYFIRKQNRANYEKINDNQKEKTELFGISPNQNV